MKRILGIVLWFACSVILAKEVSFQDWYHACEGLPRYQALSKNHYKTVLTKNMLQKEIERFFAIMTTDLSKKQWLDIPSPYFFGLNNDVFEPYVQKVVLPPGSIVAFHGDLHGDIHAVNRFILQCAMDGYMDSQNPFKIKEPRFNMVFLGDYVDRGWYGAETLYTVLRLKNENPDQVFLVRGNHEDSMINYQYGFYQEMKRKFKPLINGMYRIYNFMPLALYLCVGSDVLQCCHGGIEIGFDPRPLLTAKHAECTVIHQLKQADTYNELKKIGLNGFEPYFYNDLQITESNGFMWNDFFVDPLKSLSLSPRDGYSGTIFQYGKKSTEFLLHYWSTQTYTLRAIFRGHQHGSIKRPMMQRILNYDQLSHPNDSGVGKLWIDEWHKKHYGSLKNVPVVTFNVAPHAGYKVPYQSYGILYTDKRYEDWQLRVVKLVHNLHTKTTALNG